MPKNEEMLKRNIRYNLLLPLLSTQDFCLSLCQSASSSASFLPVRGRQHGRPGEPLASQATLEVSFQLSVPHVLEGNMGILSVPLNEDL